jgi:hypothetical protein
MPQAPIRVDNFIKVAETIPEGRRPRSAIASEGADALSGSREVCGRSLMRQALTTADGRVRKSLLQGYADYRSER